MFNGRGQPHPHFLVAKWLFFHFKLCFKRDSAGTSLPDPKGPLPASLSTETANKAVLDTCTCKCDFKNINFENLF